jgi:S-adenosylmethionine/arginine decarboxylase-like enzyme
LKKNNEYIHNVSGGLHILADLYKCSNKEYLLNHNLFYNDLITLIKSAGMNPFGHLIKYFGDENNSGYTLIIGLEESHISFHTFPLLEEDEKCAIDVYTCNISKDNGDGCRKIYEYIVELFEPDAILNLRFVERS